MSKSRTMLGILAITLIVFSGCCGPTSSPSYCTLGTYGEACTNFCEKSEGTEFDGGPACFSDCTDLVRQQGLGDATTCCRETIRAECQETCSAITSDFVSRYGDVMEPGEADEMVQQCYGECTGAYDIMGIPLDSCSMMSSETMMELLSETG